MEKRYLIPLSKFVKSLRTEWESQRVLSQQAERSTRYRKIDEHTNLITQTINLGQFIPCDLEGNVLEKPPLYLEKVTYQIENTSNYKYQEAQKRVLFKDCKPVDFGKHTQGKHIYGVHLVCNGTSIGAKSTEGWFFFDKFKTLEDIAHLNLELTENA
jgi:hypothetical protein